MLIDSHCHIDGKKFDADRDAVLSRMRESGVVKAICVGDSMKGSASSLHLAQKHPGFLFAAVGVHPHEAKDFALTDLNQLEAWLELPEVVAIGEIGLDYHYDFSPRERQQEAFLAQLDFAAEKQVPVIYHVREAHGDTISMLEEMGDMLPPGVMHCYGGSIESAKRYLDMGLYISFAGAVTFKNAHKLQEVAKYIPDDRIMVETDAPYLTPEPFRGRRNEPAFVEHTARFVASLRNADYEEFAALTAKNAEKLFSI